MDGVLTCLPEPRFVTIESDRAEINSECFAAAGLHKYLNSFDFLWCEVCPPFGRTCVYIRSVLSEYMYAR